MWKYQTKLLDKEPFFSNNTGNAKWPNTGVVGLQTKSDMEINLDATRNNIVHAGNPDFLKLTNQKEAHGLRSNYQILITVEVLKVHGLLSPN